jgi:hypothetical protein
MSLPDILTPLAMVLELLVVIFGVYVGYKLKKPFGYLLAVSFLLFALYDLFESTGLSADAMSVINLFAALTAFWAILMIYGSMKKP